MDFIICDSDRDFVSAMKMQILQICKKKGKNCRFGISESGMELIEKDLRGDIYFVEIDLPDMHGFQLAEFLKKREIDARIVFITSNTELLFRAVRFQPYGFVRKTVEDDLQVTVEYLLEAIPLQKNGIKSFTFRYGTCESTVHCAAIKYFESNGHYLTMYCTNREYRFREKLSACEAALRETGFIRIHSSYLVNIMYIKEFQVTQILLVDGTVLPVSKSRSKSARVAYELALKQRYR